MNKKFPNSNTGQVLEDLQKSKWRKMLLIDIAFVAPIAFGIAFFNEGLSFPKFLAIYGSLLALVSGRSFLRERVGINSRKASCSDSRIASVRYLGVEDVDKGPCRQALCSPQTCRRIQALLTRDIY